MRLRLADGQAADRVAVEAEGHGLARRARAQLRVRAALHDAEERPARAGPPVRVQRRAAPSAACASSERSVSSHRGGIREALVERMDDVGAERLLDLDRALRA